MKTYSVELTEEQICFLFRLLMEVAPEEPRPTLIQSLVNTFVNVISTVVLSRNPKKQ